MPTRICGEQIRDELLRGQGPGVGLNAPHCRVQGLGFDLQSPLYFLLVNQILYYRILTIKLVNQKKELQWRL